MKRLALVIACVLVGGVIVRVALNTSAEPSKAVASVAGDLPADSAISPAVSPPVAPTASPASRIGVIKGKAGFWRLAKTTNDVWWYLSPSDHQEFLNTVTTVQPYQRARAAEGPHYVSRDWVAAAGVEAPAEGSSLDRWAVTTLDRIKGVGFKGLGAWSNPAFHKYDVPMTRDLNIWSWMPGASRRLYTPEWSQIAAKAVDAQVPPLRENRNLVGYFIDNEINWGDENVGPGAYFDDLAPADPNRAEVMKVIREVWSDLPAFNADWNVTLKEWSDLDHWKVLPHDQQKTYGRLFAAWLSHLANDYFKTTTALIRAADPNHLILGVRFKGYASREVVRASRDYTDAQSLNYYVNDARLDLELFRMMHDESGQPIIISEYSFHALDGRSGNRNTVGFAAQVLDQQARADGYRLMTTRLARVPYVIGADWFQWMDEPPSGRSNDGEDVNFGVVDVDDRAYETLAGAIRATSRQLNPMHAASGTDAGSDIWRESFAEKPVMHVPYLSRPVSINGELSDWPTSAKLPNIRHSQTVGLERSPLPVPNIYVGWTRAGVYLAMEVFDNDTVGAPATGWWWTKDNAEIWLSTRPVAADQNDYNQYSHQFFFVPVDFPGSDGETGVVGQWHRQGDALKDHLVPHPGVKEACRVLPDRYVVEMFIPASAMHGFDPDASPTMAFNVHLRNFQHAIDYFWSAPKEIQTQLRPCTWGTLQLDPPDASTPALAGTPVDQAAFMR